MPIKINPKVEYAKIKLEGTISTLENTTKATIFLEADDKLYEILKEAESGKLQFTLDLDKLVEQICQQCGKPFFPEIKGPNQKYCSVSCKKKAYNQRKKEKLNSTK